MTSRVPVKRGFAAVALSVLACNPAPADESGAAEQPTFTVWDSAGIEIVENHAPEWAAGEFWTLDPVPEFVVGGVDDTGAAADPAQLVWRVVGLARIADGRVAVLSSGSKQLMLFEPSGELSRVIGGPGEGPGEFTHPLALQYLPPDTLVVWDYFLTSIDYFNPAGILVEERSLDLARMIAHGADPESLRIPLPDGSLLSGVRDMIANESPDDCTHLTETVRVQMPAGVGSDMNSLEVPVHGETLLRIDAAYAAHFFGCARPTRTPMAAGGDPPLVYISSDQTEIHQRSLDGTLERIIRRTTQPPPVTDEAWAAEVEHRARNSDMSGLPPQTEEAGPVLRREEYPAVEALLVDSEGYLWVREWSTSESGIPDHWSVFSPEGRWLGALAFPPNPVAPDRHLCRLYTTTCWIGKDHFVVVRQDELGVERVEGYRIRRDRAGGSVPL